MSEPQETRKPNRFRITSIIIAIVILASGLATISFSSMESSKSGMPTQHAQVLTTIPTGTSQTAYAYSENFSNPLDSGWLKVGYAWQPDGFKIINGELRTWANASYDGSYGMHYFNMSKQDFNISFNWRLSSECGLVGLLDIFNLRSQGMFEGNMGRYPWGIEILLLASNNSMRITHDYGNKSNPPTYLDSISSPLNFDVNYQFWMEFNRTTDKIWLRVLNKSSDALVLNQEYTTYKSSPASDMAIPDCFQIGADVSSNWAAYWDNITITYTQAVHVSTTLATSSIQGAITAHATNLVNAQVNPTDFLTGWDMKNNVLYGEIKPSILTNCRDDVGGDMMSSLATLYQYTGNAAYLSEAEQLWIVLKTHQQADYGFTFGEWNKDYSDTMGRIMLGLMAIYEATGNETYLQEAELMAPTLINYQSGHSYYYYGLFVNAGQVFGYHNRSAGYGVRNIPWFTGYFAVTLLELYKFTGNATLLEHALMATSNLINSTTQAGDVWAYGYGFGYTDKYADYTDVTNVGISLWAISEAYKVTNNATYLSVANRLAAYLVRSEFTKNGLSWGAWSGVVKERHNQSDLVYNYVIGFGLKSYLDLMPSNTDALKAYVANINFFASIQGTTDCAQGYTLYQSTGNWGGAVSFNNTATPSWTVGWWDEGGWGTWGLVAFYGWSANIVKLLMMTLTNNDPMDAIIYKDSVAIADGTSIDLGVFSSGVTSTTLSANVSLNTTIFVSSWTSETMAWSASSTSGNIAAFTLSGLESGRMYRLYIDGNQDVLLTASGSGIISFTYSGPWSEHQFEIVATSITGSISPLVNLIFIMFAIGVVVGVIVEGTYSIRKNKMLSAPEMMKLLFNMVIYIVIGIAGLGVLYSIVV